ncbi:MAG TPA: hypothetical protein VM389_03975 [Phycisphaerae bacterium]|nr:hypothetical protein [Phycisphaerae bacterium]
MTRPMRTAAIVLAVSVGAAGAADLNPSGTVTGITGLDIAAPTEAISGVIQFARLDRPHQVTVQWVDTKGRICGEQTATVAPPASSLAYRFDLANPIGYRHRVEVLVDGKRQAVSHPFTVQRPYEPWVDYYACVWAHYDPAHGELLRQVGFNGTIGPQPCAIDNDLAFYPDNIAYETFAYYHKRREEHSAMKRAWFKSPDTPTLNHRRPSLTMEGTWERAKQSLVGRIEEARPYRPIFYNMADEIGIADQSAVSDLDWEYSSRDAWRDWLQRKYGVVAELNRQWGTDHASWGKVRAFFPATNFLYDQLWARHLLPSAFKDIDGFNKAFGTKYASFDAVVAGYAAVRTDDEGMTAGGLRQTWKGLPQLNKALGEEFADFDAAAGYLAKLEQWARRQNAADTRGWNLSWWCDFRDYMDDYMATALGRAREICRQADPGGVFGVTGTHHPGVFNGHNYARLIRNTDLIIPYNIGESFELIRGLEPGFVTMHPTWQTGEKLQRDLWYHFLHGCRGVVVWDNHEPKNKTIDRKAGALTARGKAAAPVFHEITAGTDRMLIQSKWRHDGIAIYHSQASARVNWWHQNVGVGRRYILRESWHEYKEDERNALRASWMKLIEDSHLQPIFVTGRQVAEGRLGAEGVKVLILPEVWAMDDDEAARIAAFVRAGGTVIADQYTGLYDAHGRRRERGALDGLFGIDQSAVAGDVRTAAAADPGKPRPLPAKGDWTWEKLATGGPNPRGLRVVADDAEALVGDKADAGWVRRAVGQGKAVFLNLDLSHYNQTRVSRQDQAEALLGVFRTVLPETVQPVARILNAATGKRLPGTEIGVWQAGSGRKHLAIWRNYEIRKEGIGGEGLADNRLFETDGKIVAVLDRKVHVVNQRTGKSLGETSRVELTLSPWEPIILTLQDTPFGPPAVTGPDTVQRGRLLTLDIAGDKAPGTLQVFHVEAVDPGGEAVWYYSGDVSTFDGKARWTVPVALNDPTGEWTVTVRDAATRTTVQRRVRVTD